MNNNRDNIWFHADDYGVTAEQSRRILACHTQGALNSISVIPNSQALGESLSLLEQADPELRIRRVLHLNFVEGKPLAGADKVGLLVDKDGYFNRSFIQIWKWNYTKRGVKREELKSQLKQEITAQIDAVTKSYDYHITAIDAHQHYHMIPIVFDALMEVLDERKELSIQEIRIPVDPVKPLWAARDLPHRVPVVNWLKWGILKAYAGRNRRILQTKGIESPVFFGIFFTCEMKLDTVQALLPGYMRLANKKGQRLELMFHPGNLSARYELLDERSDELAEFYMSTNRYEEAECLKRLATNLK